MNILRSIVYGLWRGLDVLRRFLHLVVLLVVFGFVVGALRGSVPTVPLKAALLVAPEGDIVEQSSGDALERAVQEARGQGHAETLLWDLTDSIRAAAKDKRIQVVAIDLEKFDGAGQPTLEELAKALHEFRASGKKVISYGNEMTQERYYIAAQSDEIYVDPMGFVLIDGYARYRMFYKEALDKLGVDINVFRVGAYKSAVEEYTRTDMSPEDKQESSAYLNALWTSYRKPSRGRVSCRRTRSASTSTPWRRPCPPQVATPRRSRWKPGSSRESNPGSMSRSGSSISSVGTTRRDRSSLFPPPTTLVSRTLT